MHLKRIIYILGIFLFAIVSAQAQKFNASPGQVEVGINDDFQISWSVEGIGGTFDFPNTADFTPLGTMQSSSESFENGKYIRTITFICQYHPKKAGTFKIPGAIIRTNRGIVKSNEVTVKVTQNTPKPKQGANGKNDGSEGNGGGEYFIEATVDKANVYEGEPVTVTYRLYFYNVDTRGASLKKVPPFTGFWAKDLPDAADKQLRAENRNGKRYAAATIKKSILYPQHSGNLTIDPLEVEAAIVMQAPRKQRQAHNPFDDPFFDDPFFNDPFFGGRVEVKRKIMKSNPFVIHVNALPEAGKPDNFSGLVGNFRIYANVDKTKLKENDALTYRVTVEGTGNIQEVQPFKLNLPPDWDVYDPKTVDRAGARSFEYTIIPKKMGKYTIPPLEFSYFDLGARKYITDKTKEFEIEVEKGTGTPNGPSSGYDKEDVKLIGQDIRFIKISTDGLKKDAGNFYGSLLFWVFAILPFPLFILLLFFRRKNEENSADVAGTLRRKATGMARQRLKNAKAFMDKNDTAGFYTEVLLALYGYIQHKIGMQLAETSRENIKQVLIEHHAHEAEITRFIQLVDTCEFAKYAPSAARDNLNEVYNQSVELISALEEQLK